MPPVHVPPVYVPPVAIPLPANPAMSGEAHAGLEQTRFQQPSISSCGPPRPVDPTKDVLTTSSATRKKEVAKLHSRRMLELARASLEAFEAQAKYHSLRIREIDLLRTMARDDYEESQSFTRNVDRQIGKLRYFLQSKGIPPYFDHEIRVMKDKQAAKEAFNFSPPSSSGGSESDDLDDACDASCSNSYPSYNADEMIVA